MQNSALWEKIHLAWINRSVQQLAHGAGLKEDFRNQLERFYQLLGQVIETGNPVWLDSIILEWSLSFMQSDVEGQQTSLIQLLREMMRITFNVCRENLADDQALELFGDLSAGFAFAFEQSARFETQTKLSFYTAQLDQVRQSLEILEQSKSDFIAVAAHELKTPLTLVEGYATMLKDVMPANSGEPPGGLYLAGIETGTRRLRSIIDDMIDVSLIDNSLLSLNMQPIWINHILASLATELADPIKDRSQTMHIEDFPGINVMTYGDPERLVQGFRNVLMNAVKFTPDGGRINVTGRQLSGFIETIVVDTGIGIDIEHQQMIFEKFGRIGNIAHHSSGKVKFKGGGPGLGLHIAKGIFQAHGGTIWVESSGYDEMSCPGTRVHILLPVYQEPPDAKVALLFKNTNPSVKTGKK